MDGAGLGRGGGSEVRSLVEGGGGWEERSGS